MSIRKILAMVLAAALMLSVFAACGQSGDDSPSSSQAASTPGSKDTESSEGGEDVSGGETAPTGGLPLSEETVTLKIWQKPNSQLANITNGDFNNSEFWKELEARTNVHIDFVIPTEGSEQDQLNLMLSGGELCDLIYELPGMVAYPDGMDAGVDDGYFLDLTDMIESCAPNYLAKVNSAADYVKRAVKTDAGRYVCLYGIQAVPQEPFMGYMLREDWLKDLNLSVPETYDDWEAMLTAFKNKKGAAAPLALINNEIWNLGVGMEAMGNAFYVLDGQVRFGLTDDEENCKEYLTLLHDWYTKGLIDPDFTASTSWISGDTVVVTNNQTGAFVAMYTQPAEFAAAMEPSVSFVPVNPPKKDKNSELKFRTMDNIYTSGGFTISTKCENPELALRWVDYLFSDEGALLANFGTEGVSYTLEGGEPQFTDTILKAERVSDAINMHCMASGMPGYFADWRREFQFVGEEGKAFMDKWGELPPDRCYPGATTMSVEETADYNKIYSDMNDYIKENVSNFVTGTTSLDDFGKFVQDIRDMGIDTCKEIRQSAYDRFMAR